MQQMTTYHFHQQGTRYVYANRLNVVIKENVSKIENDNAKTMQQWCVCRRYYFRNIGVVTDLKRDLLPRHKTFCLLLGIMLTSLHENISTLLYHYDGNRWTSRGVKFSWMYA